VCARSSWAWRQRHSSIKKELAVHRNIYSWPRKGMMIRSFARPWIRCQSAGTGLVVDDRRHAIGAVITARNGAPRCHDDSMMGEALHTHSLYLTYTLYNE
jgi:hypothetical protein